MVSCRRGVSLPVPVNPTQSGLRIPAQAALLTVPPGTATFTNTTVLVVE